MISVVINTCAGSPNEAVLNTGSSFGSGKKYAARAAKLEQALAVYEKQHGIDFIVVGEWRPGDGYRYIHAPGPLQNPIDPLYQRDVGTDAAFGDVVVFMNDDHFILPADLHYLNNTAADVIAFGRRKKNVAGGTDPLQDGQPGYIMGHACCMTKRALKLVPWSSVKPTAHWDVQHTKAIKTAGLSIQYKPDIVAWDIELGELP